MFPGTAKPDPKPRKRIRDSGASRRKLLKDPWCRCCPSRAESGHHLLFRSGGGDDVEAMIVPLCGHGTKGCHGKIHAADRATLKQLGRNLRQDEILAVLKRLGTESGLDYLRRRYHLRQAQR